MAIIQKIYFKEDGRWNESTEIDLSVWELKGDKKGVSFISSKGNDRLTNDYARGFCHGRFKANFVVGNININILVSGQLLQIGDAIIKITEVEKGCISNCPIVKKSGASCAVNRQIFFGEILKAGIIKENDSIVFI